MDTSTSVIDTLTNGLKGRKVRTTTSSHQVSPTHNSNGHLCYGCNLSLDTSPIIASVSGHHKWHTHCLRCCECDDQLSQERSCFLKNGRVYCREDYAKLVSESVRCAKCFRSISPSDWVRKAGTSVYHLACFACDLCQRQLSTGEQFTIDSVESKLLCKLHFGINKEVGDSHDSSSNDSTSSSSLKPSKTKRVRTTFTEEQLQVLQANFQIDSNPDGQDLERIAALTGLSKRVTQVWFQNSRARQKKYMNKSRSSTSSTSVTSTTNGHGNNSSSSISSSSSTSPGSSSTSPASSGNGNALVLDSVATSAVISKSVANPTNGTHGNCPTSNSLSHQSPIAMLTSDGSSGHAIHPGHMLGHHSMVNHIPCHGGLPPMTAGWVPGSAGDGSTGSTIGDSIESTNGATDLIGNLISNNNSWSNMTSITNGNACDSVDDELTREASPI